MDNKSRKIKTIITSLALTVVIIFSFLLGFFVHSCSQSKTLKSVDEVLKLIDKHAISDSEVEASDVVSIVADLYLSEDEYSAYYTQKEYESIIEEQNGTFCGIGVQFLKNPEEGFSGNRIYDVTLNSPAYKAGIRANDVLLAGERKGGEKTCFKDNNEATKFLKETKESELIYLYIKSGLEEEKRIPVVKCQYSSSYVSYANSDNKAYYFLDNDKKEEMKDTVLGLDKDTGYIRLALFEGNAVNQFIGAMNLFKSENKTKLLLDLRGNGGGQMGILKVIASYLINNDGKNKNLIVFSSGKDGEDSFYTSKNNFNEKITKIVVMADENTASASECLIGAMLYYQDAFSINNLVLAYNNKRYNFSTFGKGIMQTTYTLKNGGALKLTTAKVYQPDKTTCIHDVGLTTIKENGVFNVLERALEIING